MPADSSLKFAPSVNGLDNTTRGHGRTVDSSRKEAFMKKVLAVLMALGVLEVHAQAPKPITMTRIYTTADGSSAAEEIPMKLSNGGVSEMMKASGAQFSRRPPGPPSDWHVGPRRQYVITLSGRAEL